MDPVALIAWSVIVATITLAAFWAAERWLYGRPTPPVEGPPGDTWVVEFVSDDPVALDRIADELGPESTYVAGGAMLAEVGASTAAHARRFAERVGARLGASVGTVGRGTL